MPSHKLNTELKKRGVKGTSRGHWYVEEQIHFNVALKCFSSVPCMKCSLYYLITVTAEPKHITWKNCNLTVFCSCHFLSSCSVWEIKVCQASSEVPFSITWKTLCNKLWSYPYYYIVSVTIIDVCICQFFW